MRRALIVGINDYSSEHRRLSGCVHDAKLMAKLAGSHCDPTAGANFEVVLRTSDKSSVTRASLLADLEGLFDRPSAGDCSLFYFSGHGNIRGSGGYLITQEMEDLNDGVSMTELLGLANRSRVRNKVIILDCCYAGGVGNLEVGGANLAQLSDGLTVIAASHQSEPAYEMAGSGIFTGLVVEALNGGGADLLGNVTPAGVYSYVDRALGAWNQRPLFKNNVTSFVSLRQSERPVRLEALKRLPELFPERSPHRLDPSYEEDSGPEANLDNVKTLSVLRELNTVGLVEPVDEKYMYWAAMRNKACRLTALGEHYWMLASEKRL